MSLKELHRMASALNIKDLLEEYPFWPMTVRADHLWTAIRSQDFVNQQQVKIWGIWRYPKDAHWYAAYLTLNLPETGTIIVHDVANKVVGLVGDPLFEVPVDTTKFSGKTKTYVNNLIKQHLTSHAGLVAASVRERYLRLERDSLADYFQERIKNEAR